MMTRQEQIEEMLHDLNDVVIWLDNDADIERIMPVVYWLEAELKEEKEYIDPRDRCNWDCQRRQR